MIIVSDQQGMLGTIEQVPGGLVGSSRAMQRQADQALAREHGNVPAAYARLLRSGNAYVQVRETGAQLAGGGGAVQPGLPDGQVAEIEQAVGSTDMAASIGQQMMDLAGWDDAWRHEARGPHGEWTGDAAGITGIGARIRSAEQHRTAVAGREAANDLALHNKILTEAAQQAALTRLAEERSHRRISAQQHDDMHSMMTRVRHLSQQLAEMQEQDEAKDSRLKLAIHISVIVAGAVVAAVMATMGAPAIAAIAAALGPSIVQELVDWKNRV